MIYCIFTFSTLSGLPETLLNNTTTAMNCMNSGMVGTGSGLTDEQPSPVPS